MNWDPVNKARLILTSEYFFYYQKKTWGNISEDVKGAGELKILQGTHAYLKWTGDAKIPWGTQKIQWETSRGTSMGSLLEGCIIGDLVLNFCFKSVLYVNQALESNALYSSLGTRD